MNKLFTLSQIKEAFWKQFHLSGELWFNYHGSDEDNESSTNSEWEQFVEELEKAQKGE